MVTEISGGLVVREKNLLMVMDEETGKWNVPSGRNRVGELSAEVAERVVTDTTGCTAQVSKYRKRLKTKFDQEGTEITWQPYTVEIEGEPQKGEWVSLSELAKKELAEPITDIVEKLNDRL